MQESMLAEEVEEAANAGDSDAMEQLAMAYLSGDDEIDADLEKAYYWFGKCAETGNEQVVFNVGLFTVKVVIPLLGTECTTYSGKTE